MSSCAANDLIRYTQIRTNTENFTPQYDANDNHTLSQIQSNEDITLRGNPRVYLRLFQAGK